MTTHHDLLIEQQDLADFVAACVQYADHMGYTCVEKKDYIQERLQAYNDALEREKPQPRTDPNLPLEQQFFSALKTGDFDFFADQQENLTDHPRAAQIIDLWSTRVNDSRVHNIDADSLAIVYSAVVGKDIHRYTLARECQKNDIPVRPLRINAKSTRGVPVHWRPSHAR